MEEILVVLSCIILALCLLVTMWRPGFRRAAGSLVALLAVAGGLALFAADSTSRAAEPFTMHVSPEQVAPGVDSLSMWNVGYTSARDSIAAVEAGGGESTIVFARETGAKMPGLRALEGEPNSAQFFTDDGQRRLTVLFDTTFLGQDAEVLVSGRWSGTTDVEPELAVVVRIADVELSTLNPAWDAFPVRLHNVLVGFSNVDHTLQPVAELGTDGFFEDGLPPEGDSFRVLPVGAALQAVVSDDPNGEDPLVEGAGVLGVVEAIGLRGTMGTVFSDDSDEQSTTGMDLAATVTVATPPELSEGGLTLDSTWSLQILADADNNYFAEFSGEATVSLGDEGGTPPTIGASLSINHDGSAQKTTFRLEGTAGDVHNLFGQSWFDLNALKLRTEIVRDASKSPAETSFGVLLAADMELGPVSTEALVTSKVHSTGQVDVGVGLSVAGDVAIGDVLAAIDAPAIDENWDVTLTNFGLQIQVTDPATTPATVSVAATGGATLLERTCEGTNYPGGDADLLFRLQTGGGNPTAFLAGASLTGLHVRNLDCAINFDWDLPDTMLTLGTDDINSPWLSLDRPTKDFFEDYYCGTTGEAEVCNALQRITCPSGDTVPCAATSQRLKVNSGFGLRARMEFDDDMKSALAELDIAVDGPLVVSGTVPIFGGSEMDLSVMMPTAEFDEDAIISSANLVLKIAAGPQGVTAQIEGDIGIRIERPDQGACAGAGGEFSNGNCYDLLSLWATVEIEASPGTVDPPRPPSLKLSFAAGGSADGGFTWEGAFGQPNLTINEFAVLLEVEVVGPDVRLGLGMRGDLVIGDTDLLIAFQVEVGTTPPRIILKGLTVGSNKGIALQDVVRTFAPETDETALPPDLSLKRMWFAYGTETDNTLCIRQGLFISAELHLNDPQPDPGPDSGNPACGGTGAPPLDCSASSCLAAVEIDITSTQFRVEGAISGFTAGPVESEGMDLLIDITPTEQVFYFEGAVTLYDPVDYAAQPLGTEKIWASGFLRLDVSQRTGVFGLDLTGCALVGGRTTADRECQSDEEQLLLAYLNGQLFADFTKVGGEFLDGAQASFEVRLSAPALEKLGEDIEQGFEDAAVFFEDAGDTLEGEADKVIIEIESTFCTSFNPDCPELQVTASSYDRAPDYLQGEINATDRAIRDSAALHIHCFGTFDWPVADCVNRYANDAKAANNAVIEAYGGEAGIALFGINATGFGGLVEDLDRNHYYVNPTTFVWPAGYPDTPALCDAGGELHGNAICAGGRYGPQDYDELAGDYLVEVLRDKDPALAELAESGGLSFGGDALAQSTGLDHSRFIQDLRDLGEAFDTGSPLGICQATTTFEYNGEDGPAPGSVAFDSKVSAFASKVEFGLDIVPAAGTGVSPFNRDAVHKAIVNRTLTQPLDDLNCPTAGESPTPGDLDFEMSAASIDEGDALTLTGTAAANAQVSINWGDGAESFLTADSTGAWSVSHMYEDGPAFHVVRAASGSESVAAAVTVNNVAPSTSSVELPSESDEGTVVALGVVFDDPGVLDSHTATVDWGDGSGVEVLAIAEGDEQAFSLDHQYRDDSQDLPGGIYTVTVHLEDSDGGDTTWSGNILVHNVAPHDFKLESATNGSGESVERDPEDGRLVVNEGEAIIFRGTFRDPGLDDEHTVAMNFGDGSQFNDGVEPGENAITVDLDAPGVASGDTWRDADDETLVHYEVAYAFADDQPSATPRDLMDVQAAADDGDGGVGELETSVWVANVTPDIVAAPSAQSVQYSDPVDGVTLIATDVRGYVDHDDGSWSETLQATTRWNIGGGAWSDGLPGDLALVLEHCMALERDADALPGTAQQECTWSVGGIANVAPGTYTIEFSVSDVDVAVSTVTVEIEVEPEDAEARYHGPAIFSSPQLHDGSMDVELRAVVRDITAVGEDHSLWDEHPGDIANADLTFVDATTGDTLCYAREVDYVFDGNEQVGVTTCTATFDLEPGEDLSIVDVRIVVGGWYTNEQSEREDTELTVQRPGGDFVTGGGFVEADSTPAVYGDGGRSDVNLGVQWSMPGYDSLRGETRLRFSADGRSYQVDATSFDSLGILPGDGGVEGVAHIEARATLTDRTEGGGGTSVAEDLRLQVRVTDRGGTADISFALWSDDGRLLFASGWNGDLVPQLPYAGGNVEVHIRPDGGSPGGNAGEGPRGRSR